MKSAVSIPALLAALSLLPAPAVRAQITPGPVPPPANQALARDVLAELVAIKSTHEVGTAGVAAAIAARLRAGGFSDSELTVVGDPKYPNEVNVVVRLRGKGKGKPVLWIGHEDVVDARPEDWTLPPFKLTEKDGYFYGRGSADMKNADAAMLASMVRLKAEGFVPDRDIIAAFTADEEVGLEQDGVDWLLHNRPGLVDAGLIINPDNNSGEIDNGRRTSMDVETSQKTYVTFVLEVTNRGGHSSEPRPDNAIYTLAQGLVRLAAFQFPYRTTATTRLEFARMADKQTGQTRADLLAVSGPAIDTAAAARLARDLAFNAALHSTCVATMLSAGVQENALASRAQATVQCRIMPDETPEQTRRTLETVLADPEIMITQPDPVVSGPESPPTPEVLGGVDKVVQSMWPGVIVMPTMAAGASDSLYSRSAGIPSYGLGGVFMDVRDDRTHGRDERISTASFYESVEFTYRLMKQLSRAAP